MSSEKKYYRNAGKSNHINCHACAEKVLSQNYREHLKRKHGGEDCNDLRPKNQGVILFSTFTNKRNKPENATEELAAERPMDEICIDDPLSKENDLPTTNQSLTSLSSKCIEAVGNTQDSTGNNLMKQILEKIDHLSIGISELKNNKVKETCNEKGDNPVSQDNFACKVADLLYSCRSIADITNKFVEFADDEEHSLLVCKVCLPSGGENSNPGSHESSMKRKHPGYFF